MRRQTTARLWNGRRHSAALALLPHRHRASRAPRWLGLLAIASVLVIGTSAPNSAHASSAAIIAKNKGIYSVGDRVTGTCYRKNGAWAYTEFVAEKPAVAIGRGEDDFYYVYPPPVQGNCDPLKLPHAGTYSFSTTAGATPDATGETIVSGSFKVKTLRANAGPDQSIARGETAQLDGSKSSPKKKIKSYHWKHSLGDGCPKDVSVADDAGSDKARTEFVALCSVRATLTVRDDKGRQDEDTADVDVTPRTDPSWLTPASYREGTLNGLEKFPASLFNEPNPHYEWLAGLNACANGRNWFTFCHNPKTPWAREYTLARVDDGPFKRWSYVGSSTISAHRVGFINPTLGPDQRVTGNRPNWYRFNTALAPETTTRFLAEVRAHEGAGFGLPHTGHYGALLEALRHDDGALDPRRYLEAQFGPDEGKLEERAETCLRKLDTAIFLYTLDPLNAPPNPPLHIYMWNHRIGVWVLLPLSTPLRQGPPPPLPQLPSKCGSR